MVERVVIFLPSDLLFPSFLNVSIIDPLAWKYNVKWAERKLTFSFQLAALSQELGRQAERCRVEREEVVCRVRVAYPVLAP